MLRLAFPALPLCAHVLASFSFPYNQQFVVIRVCVFLLLIADLETNCALFQGFLEIHGHQNQSYRNHILLSDRAHA